MLRDDRRQLVGLSTTDPAHVLVEGAQLTDKGTISLGHVTSAYHSVTLGRSIALALLTGGRSQIGTKLHVPLTGGAVEVTVVDPIFYDPTGARMTGSVADSERTPQSRRSVVAMPFTPPIVPPCADVALTLVPATGKFSVRTPEQIAPPLGAVIRDDHVVLWLGPDEYLVIGDRLPSIMAHSIVDVSHRTVAFRVAGPRAAWCLNAFCALDLHAVPVNFCTRTLLGKAEIILWYLGAAEFLIETARSYAPYVWALLEEARREFLPPAAAC
jgi:heterotetrameric sarcosine oxidase gamma subunit